MEIGKTIAAGVAMSGDRMRAPVTNFSQARVAIVTSGQLCRNPRVLKEAETLSQAGYDTSVITIANIRRFEAYDAELLRLARYRKLVVDQVSRALHLRLYSVWNRAQTWAARKMVRHGIESARAFGPYSSLLRLARRMPADLTIVHTEIAFCIGVALLKSGWRVAADFEDWHSRDLSPDVQKWRPRRLLESTEQILLQQCCFTTTTSHAMAEELHAQYGGRRPDVIRNVFPLQPKPPKLPRNTLPRFFWFSQTIGPGRGLESFIDGWQHMSIPAPLCLLGDISEEYRQELMTRAGSARNRLEFRAVVAPTELSSIMATYDIGLALEPFEPPNKNLTISNKIFQYLNAGLAVAATPTLGQLEVATVAPEAIKLIQLEKPNILARDLTSLATNPAQLAAMGIAARVAAEEYFSWDKEQPRLLSLVGAALSEIAR